jgi:hypothetical protein
MEQLYSFLHHDPNLVQFTNVNSGLASHARQIPGSPDILVSGIREGTYYFEFDSLDENGTPRFKKGKLLDLGKWAGDVDVLPDSNGWRMLIHGGETMLTTDSAYTRFGPETSLPNS